MKPIKIILWNLAFILGLAAAGVGFLFYQRQEERMNRMEMNQQSSVQMCVAKGGVPILAFGPLQLQRCEFPPFTTGGPTLVR